MIDHVGNGRVGASHLCITACNMFRKRDWMLVGERVILAPYSVGHVEKYHTWMQDPVLQAQTASEPLSLEDEYKMQQSWMTDENKATFIILSKELYTTHPTDTDCMVGDVNIFFTDADNPTTAEIEVMVAEPLFRGKGFGYEATQLMMFYATTELNVHKFVAKIGSDNVPSLQLFKKKVGFVEVSRSEVFNEVTLELSVTPEIGSQLHASTHTAKWLEYNRK